MLSILNAKLRFDGASVVRTHNQLPYDSTTCRAKA